MQVILHEQIDTGCNEILYDKPKGLPGLNIPADTIINIVLINIIFVYF